MSIDWVFLLMNFNSHHRGIHFVFFRFIVFRLTIYFRCSPLLQQVFLTYGGHADNEKLISRLAAASGRWSGRRCDFSVTSAQVPSGEFLQGCDWGVVQLHNVSRWIRMMGWLFPRWTVKLKLIALKNWIHNWNRLSFIFYLNWHQFLIQSVRLCLVFL